MSDYDVDPGKWEKHFGGIIRGFNIVSQDQLKYKAKCLKLGNSLKNNERERYTNGKKSKFNIGVARNIVKKFYVLKWM